MKRINLLTITVILVIFTLTGCSTNQQIEKINDESNYANVNFTSNGEVLTQRVPIQPERVVVIGDTGTETLINFKVQDSIVGISYLNQSFSKYQKDIETLPIINKSWASKEAILLLKPDLIISIDSALQAERCGTIDYWNQKGIPVIGYSDFTEGMSLEHFQNDIENIMIPFQKSQEVSDYFNSWIPEYKVVKNSPNVLFLSASPNGFYYFAPSWCLISEIIQDVGGNFVLLSDQLYLEVSKEALLKTDPSYIVLTEHLGSDPEAVKSKLTEDPLLKNLSAVQNNRLLVVNYTAAIQGNFDIPELYTGLSNLLGGEF